jgi:hypothetical protein
MGVAQAGERDALILVSFACCRFSHGDSYVFQKSIYQLSHRNVS